MTVRFDPASPERFREFVAASFGLVFDDAKLGFLGDVLRRRSETRGVPIEAYIAELEAGRGGAEAGLLAEELTVGETYFFRNNDQFRALGAVALPERMRARGASRSLSILSAGCSSGEEPYTIAMLAHDIAPTPPWNVSIRAVDLNPAALRRAAAGRFTTWSLRETPPEALRKWFVPQGRDMQLRDDIRSAVVFEPGNLLDPLAQFWRPAAYDIVFCRNVIMYFAPETQRAVVSRLAESLVPGGFLFLGHAETLRGLSHDFHLVHTHDTFYYQRKGVGDATPARHYVEMPIAPLRPEPAALATTGETGWYDEIGRASRRVAELIDTPSAADTPPQALPAKDLSGAMGLVASERFAEALDLVHGMQGETGQDPDVLLLKAVLLVQGGKLAEAAVVCEALLARDELNAGANYVLALCFEGAGDRKAAGHHYRVASYLDPTFAMPQLHLGLMSRRSGNAQAAKAELEQALTLLRHEDASRLLLFGGGFTRDALVRLCEAELSACGVRS